MTEQTVRVKFETDDEEMARISQELSAMTDGELIDCFNVSQCGLDYKNPENTRVGFLRLALLDGEFKKRRMMFLVEKEKTEGG